MRYWYRYPNNYEANTGLIVKNNDESTEYYRKYYLSNEMYSQSDRRPLLEVGYQDNGCLWDYDYEPSPTLGITWQWGATISETAHEAWKTPFEEDIADWDATSSAVEFSEAENGVLTLDVWTELGGPLGQFFETSVDGVRTAGLARLNYYYESGTAEEKRGNAGHEVGHALNLTHIILDPDWPSVDYDSVMLEPREASIDGPQSDDVDRLNSIYP